MKRKITSVQIKACTLLMILIINMVALCSCGFAQTSLHHKMKMDKNCCCCKKDSTKKDCKDAHNISFNQLDKSVADAVSLHFTAVQYFIASRFILLPENNFSFAKPAHHWQVAVDDTSPPDLQALYQSFLI